MGTLGSGDGIGVLKGVGDKTAGLLSKLGIGTVGELIRWFPRGYDTFGAPIQISAVVRGEKCAVSAAVVGMARVRKVRNLHMTEFTIRDTDCSMLVLFYNMPFLRQVLKSGVHYVFRGVVTMHGNDYVMEQPRFYSKEDYAKRMDSIQPCYGLTKGLSNGKVQKLMKQALSESVWEEDCFPPAFLQEYQLVTYREALWGIHFPDSEEHLVQARRRMSFEEFFVFVYAMQSGSKRSAIWPNSHPIRVSEECKHFLEALPFELTKAQEKVWREIGDDMAGEGCMNRLLQGDVGSGKTIIAILALLSCVESGYQGALMAPTEVLAMQHYQSILAYIQLYHLRFKPVLLTGSLSAKEKRAARDKLSCGAANLAVGTHAVIQESVEFQNLGLVITDEQHRFGARQRESLAQKGSYPHILVMSATPIPRTLAITLYGSIPVSVIDELPSNRLPIKSCVVNTSFRPSAYRFLDKEVEAGHQVYVICPLVEDDENGGEGENVADYSSKLKSVMPDHVRIATLHGKMRSGDKNQIMESFSKGDIDILVSTTVIEVGINVPNATVMMIENAERFGLAALHQLRGRVGRGSVQSYCIFISTKEDPATMERLQVLLHSNDGFYIASQDLKLRGPGDLHTKQAIRTIRQSGDFSFQFGDIYEDADVLALASLAVTRVLTSDKEDTSSLAALAQRTNGVDFSTI
jgi:ATP-dependent DNA helicase RecG